MPRAGKRPASAMYGPAKKSKTIAYGQQRQRRISGPHYKLFRYKVNATGVYNISGDRLVAACGIVETSATNAYRLKESVRITHVRILGKPPQGSTDIAEVAVEFAGGSNRGDNDRVVNSSNNPNIAPRVYAKPSKYATASDWINGNVTDTMFKVDVNAGSILEIGLSVMDPEDGQALGSVTISGGTPGNFNYLSLDTNLVVIA